MFVYSEYYKTYSYRFKKTLKDNATDDEIIAVVEEAIEHKRNYYKDFEKECRDADACLNNFHLLEEEYEQYLEETGVRFKDWCDEDSNSGR